MPMRPPKGLKMDLRGRSVAQRFTSPFPTAKHKLTLGDKSYRIHLHIYNYRHYNRDRDHGWRSY